MPHNSNSGMPYPATPGHTPQGGAPAPATSPTLPTAGLPPSPGSGDVQGRLSEQEMAELDSLVTPRLAYLLSKAYPPAFEVMRVFFGDDLMQTQGLPQAAAPAPGGPAAPTSGLAAAPVPQVPVPQGR